MNELNVMNDSIPLPPIRRFEPGPHAERHGHTREVMLGGSRRHAGAAANGCERSPEFIHPVDHRGLGTLDSYLAQILMRVRRQRAFVRDVDVTNYLSQNTIVPMTEAIAGR
jgi:hypothetical protein